MLTENNTWKSFNDLSESEKEQAYKGYKMLIDYMRSNTVITPATLAKSIGFISKDTDIPADEIPELILVFHQQALQLSVHKKLPPAGFKTLKSS